MVWRGEGHRVNVLILEQLANVGIAFDRLAVVLAFLDLLVQDVAVHVTQGHEARAFDFGQALNVGLAAPVKTNDGIADVLVGADDARDGGGLRSDPGVVLGAEGREQAHGSCSEERLFEKCAAVESFHNE